MKFLAPDVPRCGSQRIYVTAIDRYTLFMSILVFPCYNIWMVGIPELYVCVCACVCVIHRIGMLFSLLALSLLVKSNIFCYEWLFYCLLFTPPGSCLCATISLILSLLLSSSCRKMNIYIYNMYFWTCFVLNLFLSFHAKFSELWNCSTKFRVSREL